MLSIAVTDSVEAIAVDVASSFASNGSRVLVYHRENSEPPAVRESIPYEIHAPALVCPIGRSSRGNEQKVTLTVL